MSDEEALTALQRDPEVNRAAMAILIDECMCDPIYTAQMKLITVIMNEVPDERS